MLTQAVILAGGLGTRLGHWTRETPKPMLTVGGRPFLEYVVWNLRRHGINDLFFSVGYLHKKIVDHFGDGSAFGVHIEYIVESTPAGTGGALRLAKEDLDPIFLVLNGDTLMDINYLDLVLNLRQSGALASIALRRTSDSSARYGRVLLEGQRIKGFLEKNGSGSGVFSGGIYVMRNEVLDYLLSGTLSLEHNLFPVLADQGRLSGKVYKGFFIDIGVPESLYKAELVVRAWQRKPAVFLDCDCVLNLDREHVHRPDELHFIEEVPDAIKYVNERGYLVIIIINHPSITRAYGLEADFLKFTRWINEQLKPCGAHIEATYCYQPHLVEGRGIYKKDCNCPKPKKDLIGQVLSDWNIDIENSILIGGNESYLQAFQGKGTKSRHFHGGKLLSFVQEVLS